jgi:hypothetical protein
MKRIWSLTALGYVCLLHLSLALVLSKSNFVDKLRARCNLERPIVVEPGDALSGHYAVLTKTMKSGSGLVFLGDSITYSLCVESHFGAINLSIPGGTFKAAKTRVLSYKNLDGKRVVIALGVNDLARPARDVAVDCLELIDNLPRSAQVLISSVLPVDKAVFRGSTNENIQVLNEQLKTIPRIRDNVVFLDTSVHLRDESGSLRSNCHDGDGIHLNDAGYQRWLLGLNEALEHWRLLRADLG